jgi:hypothetical protein
VRGIAFILWITATQAQVCALFWNRTAVNTPTFPSDGLPANRPAGSREARSLLSEAPGAGQPARARGQP